MKKGNLESDDVFIIDNGLTIYQFNGRTCTAGKDIQSNYWGTFCFAQFLFEVTVDTILYTHILKVYFEVFKYCKS
jgi:hypothetical protein